MILFIGSILGFLSVGLGAYIDHGAKGIVSAHEYQALLTAVRYHQLYAILICLIGGALYLQLSDRIMKLLNWVGVLFTAGTLFFSFGIYFAYLLHFPKFIKITPAGGMILMGGWLLLSASAWMLFRAKTDQKQA